MSARRALILGSARPALISLLSFSTISAGVASGAPTPNQMLARVGYRIGEDHERA